MKKNIFYNYKKRLIFLLPILILLIGSSYAFLSLTLTTTKVNTITVAKLSLKLDDSSAKGISINNAEPVTDEIGLKYSPYTFTVTNDGNINSEYKVYLDDVELSAGEERLTDNYVKYSLEKDGKVISTQLLSQTGINPNRVLDTGVIKPGETYTYKLKVWLDVNTPNEAQNKVFSTQIRVEGLQETNRLSDKVFNNSNIGNSGNLDTSNSGVVYVTGTNPNNYVWYSGKLWRAVSKNTSDNSVVLVSQWNISTLKYSNTLTWLNDNRENGFLNTLYNYKNFVKENVDWGNSQIGTVGLLDLDTYTKTYQNISKSNGYLNNGLKWWVQNNNVIDEVGNNSIVSTGDYGVRPSIVLKSSVNVKSGTGTATDPYVLLGDSSVVNKDKLNTRISGEYVKFDNNIYRIVNTYDDSTKIVAINSINSRNFDTNSNLFSLSSSSNIGYYLNNVWYNSLNNDYKNMIVNKEWNVGKSKVTANVGLISNGELMSGQFETNIDYWTLTPTSDSLNYVISGTGELIKKAPTDISAVKPSMYLSSDVYIIDGKGTLEDPYIITLSLDSSSVSKYVASFLMKDNVIGIGSSSASCKYINSLSNSCDIVLPSITAPLGYTAFWTTDVNATSGFEPGTSITLSSDVTYYAKALDITSPKWELNKVTTSNNKGTVNNSDTVTIKFSGTDSSGVVNSYLNKNNIKIKLDDKEVVPTIKTLSKKTEINDGYQYTLTLSGLSGYGNLSIEIDESTLIDQSNNTSIPSSFDTKILVDAINKFTATFTKNEYVDSIGSAGLSCEAIDASGCIIKLPAINVLTGYKVLGWYDSNDVKVGNVGDSYQLTKNVILTAKAIPNSYTVTYDYKTNGGSSSTKTTDTVNYKENIDLGVMATKDGYEFIGWNTNKDATDKLNNLVMGTGDITLYAIYKKTVTANFYYYNGISQDFVQNSCTIYNNTLDSSCTFELPKAVSDSVGINNATFEGVSKNVSSTELVTDYNASVSIRYYAFYRGSWTVNYTKDIGVNTIGSTVNTCTSYKTSNGSNYVSASCNVSLPSITASTGYSVDGWYLNSDKVGNAGDNYILSSNDNLVAKANINSYTVTYDYQTNGGSSVTKTTDKVDYNSAIDLTPTATKSGYTFVGWNTNKDATSGLSSLKMGTSNVTLYAIYKKEAVTLTAKFNANGATLSSTSSVTCTLPAVYNNTAQATSCQVSAPTITRSGYTIVGYNTSSSSKTNNSSYASGKITLTTSNNNSTWYAITSKSVGATFYYYNGSAQATTSTSCTMYNTASSCNYSVPSVVSESVGPSSATYQGVASAVNSTTAATPTTGATKYYAVYQGTWTVSFAKGAGVDSIGSTSSTCISNKLTDGTGYSESTCSVALPSITASTGYNVLGWYNSNNTKVGNAGNGYIISKTETLTSKTNINSYTVTYDYQTNGGSSATKTSTTVNYNSAIDLTPTATKSGYTFVGWNTNKDATSGLSSLKMGTSNVTLYAIYKKEAVTLTAKFNANGATLSSTSSVTCTLPAVYNNTAQATSCQVSAPTITRSGYTIVGYNTSSSSKTNNSSYASGKITLTTSNNNSTWYAITSKSVGATFYYYNGSAQATTSTSCTMYNTASSCNYSVPSAVSGSIGPDSATYQGVSSAVNSTTAATPSTAYTKYYAVYKGSWTATYTKGTGVSAIGSTSSSCTNYKTTNGTTYSSTTCSITLPTITVSENYQNPRWYNGVTTYGTAGETKTLSSNVSLTAKASLIICKRATTLHTETCFSPGGSRINCTNLGYNYGSTITYGNLGTKGTLATGDAFDCDVNGDGTYDATSERFYYVKNYNSSTAALIYYSNTKNGVANDYGTIEYAHEALKTVPTTSLTFLPKKTQWSAVELVTTTRIATGLGPDAVNKKYELPGYAARFLTYEEVKSACGTTLGNNLPKKCYYLFEKTYFAAGTTLGTKTAGYWLGNYQTTGAGSNYGLAIYSNAKAGGSIENDVQDRFGVRPVIEVSHTNMSY